MASNNNLKPDKTSWLTRQLNRMFGKSATTPAPIPTNPRPGNNPIYWPDFRNQANLYEDVNLWGKPTAEQLEAMAVSHPIVFHGIQILATSFLEAVARVGKPDPESYEGWEIGTPEQSEWITRLMLRPNPIMTFQSFIQCVFQNRIATGRCYIELWRDGFGEVTELWPLPTSSVTPVLTSGRLKKDSVMRLVDHYEVALEDNSVRIVKAEDMIDYSIIDARDLSDVVSPLSTIWRELRLDLLTSNYAGSVLTNNRPPGIVVYQEDEWGEDQKEHVRKTIERQLGYGKAGGVIYMSGRGSRIESFPSISDQGQPNLQAGIEFRIAQALGVPLALLGTWGSAIYSTYNNMSTWEKLYVSYTRIPLWLSAGEAFTKILPKLWRDDGYEIVFDYSEVKAIQDDAKTTAERAVMLGNAGYLTINEVRAIAGFEATPNQGDYFMRPTSVILSAESESPPESFNIPPPFGFAAQVEASEKPLFN